MDDVDAVQAQIARNMLQSGDWVTARLDGIAYLEKSPLIYWIMATSFRFFGIHDWAARLPLAFLNIALCCITARFAMWAFGRRAGIYSGTIIATCIGIFLFTRILIPDAALTLTVILALWSFLRLLDPSEPRRANWFLVLYISLACGLLLKGLIGTVFPIAIATIYLLITREVTVREVTKRLRPFSSVALVLVIAAPWHILSTIRNPPYFDLTMHSGPGEYHGFFWFYFLNEHLFRFLNLRYPRDYNTVPRIWFWLLHFVWFFPWSMTLIAAFRHSCRPICREGKVRLLAIIWIGFVLLFFTLSTTQEYYSLPVYPAVAMLLGSDLAARERYPRSARIILAAILSISLCAIAFLLVYNAHTAVHGDISNALKQNPDMYTLSLGHMSDLTLHSFAYLRAPLVLAGCGLLIGIIATLRARRTAEIVAGLALMMIVFIQAARLALVVFDPYLSSKPLADALTRSEPGVLIEGDAYYAFSSVFFYTNQTALLWNGRSNNLEYGSNAPNAAQVFIDDGALKTLWFRDRRAYLLVYGADLPQLKDLLTNQFKVVASSGGNFLLTNQ